MRKEKISEEELLSIVDSAVGDGVSYLDGSLSRERIDAWRYYNGELPKPFHDGNSKYVSQDVFDAVDSARAQILEAFSRGGNIVEFCPEEPDDVEPARIATEYVNYVIDRQNDGDGMRYDTITNGLMARVGVVKYWWESRKEEIEETFEMITEEELDALLAEDDVDLDELEQDETSGLYSGTIIRRKDKSQVRIKVIPPEEFGVSPRAATIDSHDESFHYCFHRTPRSKQALIDDGFDAKLIEDLPAEDASDIYTSAESIERSLSAGFGGLDDPITRRTNETVMVYEVYIKLNLDGRVRLWKITKAGNVILDKEPVSEAPFVAFVPMPVPHVFHGSSFASKVIATQNARTVLTRSIIDHAVSTNNPKHMVVRGGLVNPKELMDNRHRGIVNVTRPDAVIPMPQSPLNPFVFQTIQLLDEDKEESTGISRLSQGLNKDAISKQNSQAMVNDLVSLSQTRQRIMARQFGKFLKELYLRVYNLIIEREDRKRIFEIAGSWVEVDPTSWRERRSARIELALGHGERERQAARYMQLHTALASDPSMGALYGLEERRNLWARVARAYDVVDVDSILKPVEKVEPPQPDPMMMSEMKLRELQIEIMQRQQTLAEAKFEAEQLERQQRMRFEADQAASEYAIKSDKMDLDEKRFEHKAKMDEAELEAARKAEQSTGIFAVNG